jgi:hypothetical protein
MYDCKTYMEDYELQVYDCKCKVLHSPIYLHGVVFN